MAEDKQSADPKTGAAEDAAQAANKPAREMTRLARASAEATDDMTRRSAEAIESNAREVSDRMQEAAQLWTDFAQDALHQNVETAQSLLRCRTVTDLVEVQAQWMQRSLDNVMKRSARLSELSAQLATATMSRMYSAAGTNIDEARRAGQP